MSEVTIYHNPRCSKSRTTLEILRQEGIEPAVVLESPPDKATLKRIIELLQLDSPRDVMRKGQEEYKKLNLSDVTLTEDSLLDAMIEHPVLIERPVVVVDNKRAVIGRPPEGVKSIL